MNYQEFIKNIYTSLKSINLKQQKLEEYFQTTFQKIDDLDIKVNSVSNKLDDFIDTNNRLKEEKQLALSNSLNNISDNLTTIQTEQDDIITTMTDVRNIEDNMSVLLDDFLSSENIVNDELLLNTSPDNGLITDTIEENNITMGENNITLEENNITMEANNNNIINEATEIKINLENNKNSSQILQSLDLNHESEDELLILE